MKLNKRYARSFKSNMSFYVSSTVLTITTLFLFFMMNLGGHGILDFGEKFFSEHHREDANFSTYLQISDERVAELEEKYDVVLEPQWFTNIDTDGITSRVFKKSHKINLYEVTVGSDVSSDNEIVISEGYAVANDIEVGDTITVGDKDYNIVGFMQRPDYLYMLQNESDAYKNVTTFFLAYMTDAEYDRISSGNCFYSVQYNKENSVDFRKEVNDSFYLRSYSTASDNFRIEMVDMQAEMFISISYIILVVMPAIVVILVSIIISRKVKSEQKMIGTLSAMGYTKGQLMCHYAGFAVVPGVLGGIFSEVFALIFAQPFGEMCLQVYEPMRIECHIDPMAAVLAVIVPTLMYTLAALWAVSRLLKKDTVLLLNGNSDKDKAALRKMLVGKKVSFRIKYAVRSLIGNPGRTFVVFTGIFLGSYISLLGFSFLDAMENTGDNMGEALGTYRYQYVLNELAQDGDYDGETLLMSTVELENGKQLTFMGVGENNPYLTLTDIDGKPVNLKDGFYITNVVAKLQGIAKDDEIVILNPFTLEKKSIQVAGIIDSDIQSTIFTDRASAAELLEMDASAGNVIMSDKALAIPDDKLLQTIKKEDAREQYDNMTSQMDIMIYIVIILGAVICISAVYVAVNMLVTENSANISMLKVLGYDDKNINRIVLRVNHIVLPIGYLAAIPLVYASADWMFRYLAEFIGAIIKTYISPKSFIYTMILVLISYFGSLLLIRHKVSKVNMVESLKDNRE